MRNLNEELAKLYPADFAKLNTVGYFGAAQKSFNLANLKAYYKYNEASGDIINQASEVGSSDEIANSQLIVTGATYGATGKIDDALSFDGVNDDAQADSSAIADWKFLHDGTTDWAVAFWLKLVVAEPAGIHYILGTDNVSVSERGLDIILRDNSSPDHNLRATIRTGSAAIAFLNTTADYIPVDTNFHFYIIQYDESTKTLYAYRDGDANVESVVGSGSESTSNPQAKLIQATNPSLSQYANIVLDECSIWSRLMDGTERDDLYNSGNGLAL